MRRGEPMTFSKRHLISAFIFSASLITKVFAEDLPKGNETGNRLAPSEALVKMIDEQNVFVIDKEKMGCPSIVQLRKNNNASFAKGKLEEGDILFELDGYKAYENEELTWDNFTHENHRFVFKPKLKGKSKNLGDGCSIMAGIACRYDYQTTSGDSVKFEASARIYSIAMIASIDSSVQINPEKKRITYFFKGNGVDDLICDYGPAPTTVKAKVLTYKANREAERMKNENSLKVNNSNRANIKNVDGESKKISSGSKTISK